MKLNREEMKNVLGGSTQLPGTGTTCSTTCKSGRDAQILNCNGTCVAVNEQYAQCSDPNTRANCDNN